MNMSLRTLDAATGELLPAPRNLNSELFLDFDRRDDDQIMAELRGEAVEQYVYSFNQGGSAVTGLSLAGVMAVAQSMGGITCGQPVFAVDDDEITCDISATDHKNGLTVWGTATETRVMRTKNGDKPDKFARGKALSKAQRNAIRKLIPEQIAVEMLRQFINGGKPQRGTAPRQPAQQRPAVAAPVARPIVEVLTEEAELSPGEQISDILGRLALATTKRDLKPIQQDIQAWGLADDDEVKAAYNEQWHEIHAAENAAVK
jgi:hypothetical protein